MEQVIFKDLILNAAYHKILFVGCDYHTGWYATLFEMFAEVKFSTIEIDPAKARFGSRIDHRVGRFESLRTAPEEASAYDLVILNGIFGFGTDAPETKAAVLATIPHVLKAAGKVLIGHDEISDSYRFDSKALEQLGFKPAPIPGIRAYSYSTTGSKGQPYRYICFQRIPN